MQIVFRCKQKIYKINSDLKSESNRFNDLQRTLLPKKLASANILSFKITDKAKLYRS